MKTNICLSFLSILFLVLLLNKVSYSQSVPSDEEQYLAFATTMPELDGGMAELSKKIKYPPIALKTKTEGKVFAMAYVDEKGKVDKVKIIKGLGAGCDEEVVRVLSDSKFKPGQHEGKPVKVKTTISVVFKIQ